MTRARNQIMNPDLTSYYHCMVRCVRRAYLCGDDKHSGKNYDHRKSWVVGRLKQLASIFAIDICAYAVMSNHYHLVLHINADKAKTWTHQEIVERWQTLFKGNLLVDAWVSGEALSISKRDTVYEIIEEWRSRLMDISWFMRCMNESIARFANKEDNCGGRFWEGRFKSQALLDEAALLTCMAYVDLNPIRAGIANTPEDSDFTSIQERIVEYSKKQKEKTKAQQKRIQAHAQQIEEQKSLMQNPKIPFSPLMQMKGYEKENMPEAIFFSQKDYFELVDWTGRILRKDKKSSISENTPPILQRLDIDAKSWINYLPKFGNLFSHSIGKPKILRQFSETYERSWVKGVLNGASIYPDRKESIAA